MVTITDATFNQNLYETIYDLLVASSLMSTSDGVPTVTAAYISQSTSGLDVFPQIVVHSPETDFSEFSFNRQAHTKDARVMIEIFTKKAKHKDILADSITNTLVPYVWSGVQLQGVTSGEALEPLDGSKIHLKTLMFTFVRR
jgi:hypothetical protein